MKEANNFEGRTPLQGIPERIAEALQIQARQDIDSALPIIRQLAISGDPNERTAVAIIMEEIAVLYSAKHEHIGPVTHLWLDLASDPQHESDEAARYALSLAIESSSLHAVDVASIVSVMFSRFVDGDVEDEWNKR